MLLEPAETSLIRRYFVCLSGQVIAAAMVSSRCELKPVL